MPCAQRASSSPICMASAVVRRTQSAPSATVIRSRFWSVMAPSGPDAAVRSDAGLARADDQQAVHLDGCRVEVGEGGGRQALARTADVATHDDRGRRIAVLQQDPLCRANLITPTS